MLYTVFVDDNYHYMDESERYKLGEFLDCASAVAACKQIVDEFLATCILDKGEDEILRQYLHFGEDPWISSDDRECRFSSRYYALQSVKEVAGNK